MENTIYYHFLPACYALDDLEKKRLKVSRLDSLNDPFEIKPYKRYSQEKRRLYDKVFDRISKKWGLICFCESWEEQLLWAHYADKHKGIALGFNILRDKLIKVQYPSDKKRPIIELTNDPDVDESNFLKIADKKYELWKYEKEYRILVRLSECKLDGGNYFLPFGGRLKVTTIALGCLFDHLKYKERVCNLACEAGAEVIPTRQEWQGYKILINGTRRKQYQEIIQNIVR